MIEFVLSLVGMLMVLTLSFIGGFICCVDIIFSKAEEVLTQEECEDYKELTKKIFEF